MGLFLKTPVGFLKKKHPGEWDYFWKRLSDSWKKNILKSGIISGNACLIPEKNILENDIIFLKTPVGFLKGKKQTT